MHRRNAERGDKTDHHSAAGVADAGEIASAVVILASPDASYVNGAILHATGGQRAIVA